MKYIVMLVMITAFLPGVGTNINLGIFYLSLFRISLCVLVGIYFLKYLKFKKLDYRIKKNNFLPLLFLTIWFLYSLFSVCWAKNLPDWIHGEYFIGIGFLAVLFFDMANLKSENFFEILIGVQYTLIIHNIIGWYEVFTHHYLFAPIERISIMSKSNQYFPISMFANQNDFMLVLLLGMGISFFFVCTCKKKILKIINLFFTLSNIILCILTDSRVGIISAVLLLFVEICFLLPKKIRKIGIVVGAVFSLIILAAFQYLLISQADMIINNSFLTASANPIVDSDAVRLNLIKNGLFFLKETCGFGVGTGNAEYWIENYAVYYTRGFVNIHNWWIEILTNFGIIMFAGYICFYGYLLYSLYKRFKYSETTEKYFCIMLIGFLIAFIPASISSSSNWGKEWLWMWFAFIVAYVGTEVNSDM